MPCCLIVSIASDHDPIIETSATSASRAENNVAIAPVPMIEICMMTHLSQMCHSAWRAPDAMRQTGREEPRSGDEESLSCQSRKQAVEEILRDLRSLRMTRSI